MTEPETFEDRLRRDLLAAVPPHQERRRRRAQVLVVALTAVLVLGGGWVVASRDPGTSERASTGPSSNDEPSSAPPSTGPSTTPSTSTTEPPEPTPGAVLDEPSLTPEVADAAGELVDTFLAHLREGDVDAAVALISEYATMTGSGTGGGRATVEHFATEHAWLLADPDPELSVTPSPGWQVASPVVTAVAEVGDGTYRAAAFVLNDGLSGPEAGMQIQRLPEGEGTATTPAPGTSVAAGHQVSFPGGPTEGGARAFVDGDEVPVAYGGDAGDVVLVTVPADARDGVVVTVSLSTPELPGAAAAWYPVAAG